MTSRWEEFYATHLPPSDFEDNRSLLKEFCDRHNKLAKRIVLITSGGTTVPLEHNTVRFVDNFSAGNRGAASAEYFLDHDYCVIFLYRQKSLEPFTRHFSGQRLLDMLDIHNTSGNTAISVKPDSVDILEPVLVNYKAAREGGKILYITFTTLSDYFWLLRASCECLSVFKERALLYLAAAVSDFYIPPSEIPTHKIQSSLGVPSIQLQLVPKLLAPLVDSWVPNAFIVSFKLETDESILIQKGREALNRYKHKCDVTYLETIQKNVLRYLPFQATLPALLGAEYVRVIFNHDSLQLVICNMLQSRRQRVVFVSHENSIEIALTKEQLLNGIEIEESIVVNVIAYHDQFLTSS